MPMPSLTLPRPFGWTQTKEYFTWIDLAPITASARTPRLCATLKSPKLEAPLSMRPICKVCNSHDLKVAESVGSLQGGFKVVGEGFPSLTIRNVFCASISVSSSARRERLLQRFHHPNH